MEKEFKEFKLGEVLDLRGSKKVINKNTIKNFEGRYPYVTRSEKNNGIVEYIEHDEDNLNKGNSITLGMDTYVVNYQSDDYFTGNRVNIIRYRGINEYNAKYMVTVLRGLFKDYKWGDGLTQKQIKELIMRLPVTDSGKIDWAYMENYMKRVEDETERIINLLNKVTLNAGGITLEPYSFGEFKIEDLFEGYIGKFVPAKNRSDVKTDDFNIPLITSQTTNNGIQSYVREGEHEMLEDCLSISKDGVHAGTVFYQEGKFSLGNVAMGIYANKEYTERFTKRVYLYIGTLLEKEAKSFGGYDKKVGWNLFKKTIKIPLTENGDIDWGYMEEFMKYQEDMAKMKLELLGLVVEG